MPTEVQTIPLGRRGHPVGCSARKRRPTPPSYVEIYLVDSEDSNDNAQSSGGKSYGEERSITVTRSGCSQDRRKIWCHDRGSLPCVG
ncbi:MAG: hypothetical protein U1F57_06465 [bacterium]